MNLKIDKWTEEDYHLFINYLNSLSDIKYKEFSSKIGTSKNVIGVRIPLIRSLAKAIALGDYQGFIRLNTHNTREEIIIHGLILGYIKIPFTDLLMMIDEFLKYNNSWETNDTTVSNLKVFKKNRVEGLKYIEILVKSDNPYTIRFGLILLLAYYKDNIYTDTILSTIDNISSTEYYVKMGAAWLVQEEYIHAPLATLKWLKRTNIDTFTYNKSISKICDSYRVSKKDKETLKKMRRNK